mgnify:CR=1 FL=1
MSPGETRLLGGNPITTARAAQREDRRAIPLGVFKDTCLDGKMGLFPILTTAATEQSS